MWTILHCVVHLAHDILNRKKDKSSRLVHGGRICFKSCSHALTPIRFHIWGCFDVNYLHAACAVALNTASNITAKFPLCMIQTFTGFLIWKYLFIEARLHGRELLALKYLLIHKLPRLVQSLCSIFVEGSPSAKDHE